MNWRYAPEADSDGFTIGVDHFVVDDDGNEIVLAADEASGRLIAAAPKMAAAIRAIVAPGSGAAMHGDVWAKVRLALDALGIDEPF